MMSSESDKSPNYPLSPTAVPQIYAFKHLHLAMGFNSIFQFDDRGCTTVDHTLSSFEQMSWSAMYGPISFSAFPPTLSRSAFYVSRALLQFKLDHVECLLEALDNVNRFKRIHDTFAFLFIDGFFQHIYFVDKVCMQMMQPGTGIIVFVHRVLLPLD
jgi:hypothetical protein